MQAGARHPVACRNARISSCALWEQEPGRFAKPSAGRRKRSLTAPASIGRTWPESRRGCEIRRSEPWRNSHEGLASACLNSSKTFPDRQTVLSCPHPSSCIQSSAMAKHSTHILEMARKGAEHRYEELRGEIATLVKNFPHLAARAGKQVSRTVSNGRTVVEAETPKIRRRARKMSAAARKAVSERMKKYWAGRRKQKASTK